MSRSIKGVSRLYSTTGQAQIASTLLLTRAPQITADVPAFELRYFSYQKELFKRLMWTFPKWFYFREGTLAEQRYRQLNKDPIDNNPDIVFPKGAPEIRQNRDRRFKQELRLPKTYKEADQLDGTESPTSKDDLSRKIIPNSRITEADKSNNQSSLERALARTLYLVIQDSKSDKWTFPNFKNDSSNLKPLDKLAEDGIINLNTEKLNYFNVSSKPCHVYTNTSENQKDYIIKSYILSGQFKPTDDLKFLWLSKEELSEKLDKDYYSEISHLFSDI